VTIPESMDAIHSMILDDWRVSAKKMAEMAMAMSWESVGYTIHDI
jgi:hypothetical protein